jgi:alginate O-acetyltransferase complex protein AlgI
MLFTSFDFLFFLPAVLGLYFALPPGRRWMLLLAASYYFYASWKPAYLLLIMFSTAVDYLAALRMEALPDRRSRRPWLLLSLFANLGLLFTFKYWGFFFESWNALALRYGLFQVWPSLQVLLPVGISFYTFQTLAYTLDVYRGKLRAERHPGYFALYVAYFPQLVAGPIERAGHLLPELKTEHVFSYARARAGMLLIALGYLKKLVLADRAGEYVDRMYQQAATGDGLVNLAATYLFAFQLYADFSAYSDIAIGTALIMGVRLMTNFRRPYLARSLRDFWQRWHISLSTWFRDYLYIPLGGNRSGPARWAINLLITFVLSGLWHGASWNFVVWGALHGIFLLLGLAWAPGWKGLQRALRLDRRPALLRLAETLLVFHLVLLGWVFFRAADLHQALDVLQSFARIRPGSVAALAASFGRFGWLETGIALGSIAGLMFVQVLAERGWDVKTRLLEQPLWLRWSAYLVIALSLALLGRLGSPTEFIYFQF